MSKRKTKKDETRIDSYGRGEVLDEKWRENPPERELWAAVIIQAISNVYFKVNRWEEDLFFISGGRQWNWICEQLGMNAKSMSIGAIKAAFGDFGKVNKHYTV